MFVRLLSFLPTLPSRSLALLFAARTGARGLRIIFDRRCRTEQGCDRLYFFRDAGYSTQIADRTGTGRYAPLLIPNVDTGQRGSVTREVRAGASSAGVDVAQVNAWASEYAIDADDGKAPRPCTLRTNSRADTDVVEGVAARFALPVLSHCG